MMRMRLSWSALLLLPGLVACTLPSAGPTYSDIKEQSVDQSGPAPVSNYAVVDIDGRVNGVLDQEERDTPLRRFGDIRPPPSAVIGVGDVVAITIWEAASGGLFSNLPTSQSVAGGSRGVPLPDQMVGSNGTITVPFAGNIRAAGLTPVAVQQKIVDALNEKTSDPQAVVTIAKNVSRAVSVTGEVIAGSRVQLSPQGDRILDVIAQAGGIRAPVFEMYVQLTRGSTTVRFPMSSIVLHPRENIFVWPGDTLTLTRTPRTFTAFGAVGNNSLISIDQDDLTLEIAMAKAGGLQDYRSDPRGVFLMRMEPANIVGQLAPQYPIPVGQKLVPVIFRLDMQKPGSFFAAKEFPVKDKDILYVSNAPLTNVQKFLGIIGSITGPVFGGASLYGLTK